MSFDFELINSDISIKSDGSVRVVSGASKLKQDIIKIILTPIGSVRLHPWYGSLISDSVIGQSLSDEALFGDIQASINQSLDRLKKLQSAQASGQRVSNDELIAVIENIVVQRAYYDLRQVNVVVSVLTRSLARVSETFEIS